MCALLDSGRNGLGEGGVGRQVNVHLKVQGSYLISLEINYFSFFKLIHLNVTEDKSELFYQQQNCRKAKLLKILVIVKTIQSPDYNMYCTYT